MRHAGTGLSVSSHTMAPSGGCISHVVWRCVICSICQICLSIYFTYLKIQQCCAKKNETRKRPLLFLVGFVITMRNFDYELKLVRNIKRTDRWSMIDNQWSMIDDRLSTMDDRLSIVDQWSMIDNQLSYRWTGVHRSPFRWDSITIESSLTKWK